MLLLLFNQQSPGGPPNPATGNGYQAGQFATGSGSTFSTQFSATATIPIVTSATLVVSAPL
jgi:hypothetical protein